MRCFYIFCGVFVSLGLCTAVGEQRELRHDRSLRAVSERWSDKPNKSAKPEKNGNKSAKPEKNGQVEEPRDQLRDDIRTVRSDRAFTHPYDSGKTASKKFRDTFEKEADKLPDVLERETSSMHQTFLPDWDFNWIIFIKAIVTVTLSIAWFTFYNNYVYTDDRSDSLERWEAQLAVAADLDDAGAHFHPDLIIVFHHPDFPNPDAEKVLTAKSIDRVRCDGAGDGMTLFEEKHKLALELEEENKGLQNQLRSLSSTVARPLGGGSKEDPRTEQLTKRCVRTAILKDLYVQVPLWGFDLTCFTSIDGDELFVGISLSSFEAVEYYIDRNGINLQLRKDIAAKIGVDQDQDDPCSSPPLMQPNLRMAQGLHAQGIIESPTGADLFRDYHDSANGTHISTAERMRIVMKELCHCLDLNAAQEEGLIVSCYPVHKPTARKRLRAMWANWRSLKDLTFAQPIPAMADYLGQRIAFLFAWNGVYAKWLLALMAVAVCQVTVISILKYGLGIYIFKHRQVIGFCVVVALWSKIVFNMWERESGFFVELWNLNETHRDRHVRPQFVGSPAPSDLDRNKDDKVFCKAAATRRLILSGCITVFLCLLAGCAIFIWMIAFEDNMSLMSSILLALQIKVFGAIFYSVACLLTNYENHKFQDDYHDSFLWKIFLFEFVNNYSAFFFLTIWAEWTDKECPGDDCLIVLRTQLAATLCVLSICSILSSSINQISVKFSLYWEVRQYRNKFGKEPPTRFAMEEQAKYTKLGEDEEVMNMMTLMIALGYILIFGGVSAICVPLGFCVFAIQLRAVATQYTDCGQRAFPQRTPGIGSWKMVVRFLMATGVIYSGFLFAAYGSSFKGAPLLSRMTGFFLFCFFIFSSWGLIDVFVPADDGCVSLLARRRNYVTMQLMRKAESSDLGSELKDALRAEHMFFSKEVENDEWSKIPKLAGDGEETPEESLRRLSYATDGRPHIDS
jgi:hypothetical protein